MSIGRGAPAAADPFAGGWTLVPEASSLTFQSIKMKDGPVSETSRFAGLSGNVDEAGLATLKVLLESVDTKVDLRNVRMRFLFFETFRYPEATITSMLDPQTMAELADVRRVATPLTFELDLHGITRSMTVDATLTQFSDRRVSVASAEPVVIDVVDFALGEGIEKLQDAAKVSIVPSARVSFDLVFERGTVPEPDPDAPQAQRPAALTPTATVVSAAVETEGDFSVEECVGRFEILSRAGAIYFDSGSARLDDKSTPMLEAVAEIMKRCPDRRILISGHTDSIGDEALNMRLSLSRADAVLAYLSETGVPRQRMRSTGYGETRPIAANDSRRNRSRNRRIEFSAQ